MRLCDLRPDGTSALITFGVLNLTHHASHEHPTALIPGEAIEVDFALDQIAYRLPQGHRLRVAISTSYWPTIWPSPECAAVTIHSGERWTCRPGRPVAGDDEWVFEEPVGATPWRAETLRESSYSRLTETDAETGIVTIAIDEDSGENRDLEHGLISGSWFKERFHIHPDDPLSARLSAEWEQTGGREGQMWRTHVVAEMSSDVDAFHTTARLEAYLNGKLFFARDYEDRVLRDLV